MGSSINIKKESKVKMYDKPKVNKLPENIHDHIAEFGDQDQDIYEKIKSDSKKQTKVKMYDVLEFDKLPRNIHNHISEFVRENIYTKIRREVMNYFLWTPKYFHPVYSYDHENGFINLRVDVKRDRYNYYLRKDTYYEFQQLGLQKITVYLKSETEKEINKS